MDIGQQIKLDGKLILIAINLNLIKSDTNDQQAMSVSMIKHYLSFINFSLHVQVTLRISRKRRPAWL
jgi:hypothetical protein